MGFLSAFWKSKKAEEKQLSSKEAVKVSALEELKNLSYNKKSMLRLAEIIRNFFKDYFRLRYQFTYNELKEELKKKKIKHEIKEKIAYLLEKFSSDEYEKGSMSNTDFKMAKANLEEVIGLLK